MGREQRKYKKEYKVEAVKLAKEVGASKAAGIGSKFANSITQTINDFIECGKDLVMKSSGPQFLPYLLNGIHFWRIVRNEHEFNIIKTVEKE